MKNLNAIQQFDTPDHSTYQSFCSTVQIAPIQKSFSLNSYSDATDLANKSID